MCTSISVLTFPRIFVALGDQESAFKILSLERKLHKCSKVKLSGAACVTEHCIPVPCSLSTFSFCSGKRNTAVGEY